MPSRSSSRSRSIDKLDFDAERRQQTQGREAEPSEQTSLLASDESFFSDVVEGAVERDRRKMAQMITKYTSFFCALLSCLCAGSITAFSLYGPLFISHLRYTQYQVNAVSTIAELSMYLLTPLYGWLCDRFSPRPLSVVSGVLFGGGYLLAALTYHAGPTLYELDEKSGIQIQQQGWPFGVMMLGFMGVGAGTTAMYLSAVTTCAKNFGRGKHRGLALALPIAAFGLSGLWQSQVGSHFFKEQGTGDVDVFRFFLFLAGLFFAVGLIGGAGLRVVGEEEYIDEAVEELERSGLLEDSHFFRDRETTGASDRGNGYGTAEGNRTTTASTSHQRDARPEFKTSFKKHLVLRLSLPTFFRDPTMWLLALGFFLTTGPGETYMNNIGTLLNTSYPAPSSGPPSSNSPATHVSIIALTSTLARLVTGAITDLFAPPSATSENESIASGQGHKRYTFSRIWFLLISTVLFSIGQLLLATNAAFFDPGTVFPISSALVGLGYGAIFSLTPIIVNCVWGVESFGTNWGIVAVVPGAGATLWSFIYARIYQAGVEDNGSLECFGAKCYRSTFFAMTVASWVALALWIAAWRGWRRRGIVV